MSEQIPTPEQEPQITSAEVVEGHSISERALNTIMQGAGVEIPEITNFAEAKAFKKWQNTQTPELQAAANAMEEARQRKETEEAARLEAEAQQVAQNPNMITGVPDHLK